MTNNERTGFILRLVQLSNSHNYCMIRNDMENATKMGINLENMKVLARMMGHNVTLVYGEDHQITKIIPDTGLGEITYPNHYYKTSAGIIERR